MHPPGKKPHPSITVEFCRRNLKYLGRHLKNIGRNVNDFVRNVYDLVAILTILIDISYSLVESHLMILIPIAKILVYSPNVTAVD